MIITIISLFQAESPIDKKKHAYKYIIKLTIIMEKWQI